MVKKRFFRNQGTDPICAVLQSIALLVPAVYLIYFWLAAFPDFSEWPEKVIIGSYFFVPVSIWMFMFFGRGLIAGLLEVRHLFLKNNGMVFFRDHTFVGAPFPFIRDGRTEMWQRRVNYHSHRKFTVAYDSIVAIRQHNIVLVLLGLARPHAFIDYRKTDGSIHGLRLSPSIAEYGLLMERLGALCPNLRRFDAIDEKWVRKERAPDFWEKEPDWPTLRAIFAKVNRNRRIQDATLTASTGESSEKVRNREESNSN